MTNMLTTCYGSMLTIISFNILFYRLKMSDKESNKKSASEIIQIDTIVPKTPKVHRDTNQETRKAAVQLNIVEVDENVTSEPCCTPTTGPIPCQIFKWVWKIIKWIANLFFLLMSWFLGFLIVLFALAVGVYLFWAACVQTAQIFSTHFIFLHMFLNLLTYLTAFMWLGSVVFCLIGAPWHFAQLTWREVLMESLRLLKC